MTTSNEVTGPTYDAVQRRLERLADRLRVVGPRLAAREGEAARQVLGEIRAGLQRLADCAADADGEPRRAVPALAPHALADQVLVLGFDLLGAPGQRNSAVLAAAMLTLEDVNRLV
ncbi:MAG TPA: hypothetical protein VLL08_06420 [Kineosporiaceae bacterium]|nr:hypothetical protein [Kineosporiaceae bacterium]